MSATSTIRKSEVGELRRDHDISATGPQYAGRMVVNDHLSTLEMLHRRRGGLQVAPGDLFDRDDDHLVVGFTYQDDLVATGVADR